MMKKRLIFSLLFTDGYFIQSRNFRSQRVGDVKWLLNNYHFETIAQAIDELVIVSVSRKREQTEEFLKVAKTLSRTCFMPKMFGGAITKIDDAKRLFDSGADKVILNTSLFTNKNDVQLISSTFGSQAVVGCLDCKWNTQLQSFDVYIKNSSQKLDISFKDALKEAVDAGVGEIMLQSIDSDGTGNGLDLRLVERFQEAVSDSKVPLILAGGAGNFEHIKTALEQEGTSAILTANLLNFMGDSLKRTRDQLIEMGMNLPKFYSL